VVTEAAVLAVTEAVVMEVAVLEAVDMVEAAVDTEEVATEVVLEAGATGVVLEED
jgi:hypothetical protein